MKTITHAMLLVLLSPLICLSDDKPAESSETSDWRPLFNGKNLDGWEHVGPGKMVIEDGQIRTEGGMGLLWYTKEKFGDCSIRVVYKVTSPVSNAGVFIRIADKPRDEWFAVHHGYEVQICDSPKTDDYHCTGAIYSLAKVKSRPAKPPGEWDTMEITLKGPRVIVAVNGDLVNEFDPKQPVPERTKDWEPERGPRPEVGYIGLQNHDDYAKGTQVYYKDVSVQPLTKSR